MDQIGGDNVLDNDSTGEDKWGKFHKKCLKWRPTGAELKQRWYRHRFTDFVRKEFKHMGKEVPKPLGNEDVFFTSYPHLREKWNIIRQEAEANEPTEALLLERWIQQRRFEFKKNYHKRVRGDEAYNIRNEKVVRGDVGAVCNLRSHHWDILSVTYQVVLVLFLVFAIRFLYRINS